ncbi:MAG: HAMP domain-containing protein [Blastocatellia bacterium]|nr:HAMP domain-containing protein [Blastocatellia bacterium]
MKLDIRLKLFGAFIVVLILGVTVVFTLLNLLVGVSQNLEKIISVNFALEQKMKEVKYQIVNTNDAIHSLMLNPTATTELERQSNAIQRIFTNLAELKQFALTPEFGSLLKDLNDLENKSADIIKEKLIPTIQKPDLEAAKQIFQQEYLPIYKQQETLVENIIALSITQRTNLSQSAISNRNLSKWVVLVASLVFSLVCLLMAAFLNRTITVPIVRLASLLKRAAKGDLVDNYRYNERNDEIGELSRSLNSFYEYIREMGVTAIKIASGNLTVQVKPLSQVDSFGTAFSTMIETLQTAIGDLRKTSDQLSQASSQMAAASEQTSRMNDMASSSIEETSAAMHQMSVNIENVVNSTQTQLEFVTETSHRIEQMIVSIEEVAEMAKKMFAIAEKSSKEVAIGVGAMANSSEGIVKINASINRTAETIKALEKRTEDIGKIADLIGYLADQTNLLSLNAAIEAARAGEHGLGFAVVAEEVRKLAERSAKSTREIDQIIKGIQGEALKATEDMDKSTEIASQLLGQGQEVTTALKRIEKTVTEVCQYSQNIVNATEQQNAASEQIAQATIKLRELMQEINAAGQEQSVGAKQVAKAVEMLRELIVQNASSSQDLATSGQQLAKQSDLLQNVIGRFAVESHKLVKEEKSQLVMV